MTKFFLLLLLLPVFAEAAPKKIVKAEVWAVRGNYALSLPQTIRLTQKATAKIRGELGVRIQVTRYRRTSSRFNEFNDINDYRKLFPKWNAWTWANSPHDRLRVVVLPPMSSPEGFIYFAGSANICLPNGMAWVNAGMQNFEGKPRFKTSVGALTHELGHLIGAPHDDLSSISIMNPDAGRLVSELGLKNVRFSEAAKLAVENCMNLF